MKRFSPKAGMEVESIAEAVNIYTQRFYIHWLHCTKLCGVITDRTTVRTLLGITATGAKAKFVLAHREKIKNTLRRLKFGQRSWYS
jgi:hypothetical protein